MNSPETEIRYLHPLIVFRMRGLRALVEDSFERADSVSYCYLLSEGMQQEAVTQ